MGKDGQEGRMSDERQQYGIPENISEKEDTQSQKVFGDSGGGNRVGGYASGISGHW